MRIEPTLQVEKGRALRDYNIYAPPSSFWLLLAAVTLLSCLVAISVLRSAELWPDRIFLIVAGYFTASSLVAGVLRPYLRDLYSDLSLRERAFIGLGHVLVFVAPTLLVDPWYLVYSTFALVVSHHLLLVERQHFVRLLSLQLATLFLAELTSVHDDNMNFLLVLGSVVLLALAAHLLRLSFLMEKYDTTFPISLRWLAGALGPTVLAVAAVALGIWFFHPTTPFNARPTLHLPGAGIGARTPSPYASAGGIGPFVFKALFWSAVVLTLLWLAARVAERLRKQSEAEVEMDLAVQAEMEPEALGAPRRRSKPPADARQRIIAAYVDFCRKVGRIAHRRAPSVTASEYSLSLSASNLIERAGEDVDVLTREFERARYAEAKISEAEAEEFTSRAAELIDRLKAWAREQRRARRGGWPRI